ncbi:MAG: DUF433 domain-containing protein [Myxococcales bacterium]|nr:DUF433 domain-containing protein [Myxococcales bacterium]
MKEKEIAHRITIDEKVLSGRPTIRGTRVPVELVLGQLAGGMLIEDVCQEYDITHDDVLAALAYAANILAEDQTRAVS